MTADSLSADLSTPGDSYNPLLVLLINPVTATSPELLSFRQSDSAISLGLFCPASSPDTPTSYESCVSDNPSLEDPPTLPLVPSSYPLSDLAPTTGAFTLLLSSLLPLLFSLLFASLLPPLGLLFHPLRLRCGPFFDESSLPRRRKPYF